MYANINYTYRYTVRITMDVYNDATKEKRTDTFKNIKGKMRILELLIYDNFYDK